MVRQTELFVNPNNQKFENMKNALRGINFLHLCTINDDRIIFCPFNLPPPPLPPFFPALDSLENQNFEK